jgi:hypothetical protein
MILADDFQIWIVEEMDGGTQRDPVVFTDRPSLEAYCTLMWQAFIDSERKDLELSGLLIPEGFPTLTGVHEDDAENMHAYLEWATIDYYFCIRWFTREDVNPVWDGELPESEQLEPVAS